MTDRVPATEKLNLHIELVLEHVVRGVKVVLELLDVGELEAEVAREVVGAEFEGNFLDELFVVDLDANFEVELVDQLVGNVLFG